MNTISEKEKVHQDALDRICGILIELQDETEKIVTPDYARIKGERDSIALENAELISKLRKLEEMNVNYKVLLFRCLALRGIGHQESEHQGNTREMSMRADAIINDIFEALSCDSYTDAKNAYGRK